MKTKQELLIEMLEKRLETTKIGLLVKAVAEIEPMAVVEQLSQRRSKKLHAAIVGYEHSSVLETDHFAISLMIEDAVKWRSKPELSGSILAFVRGDSDKMHSLAEFDVVTTRDLSNHLIQNCIAASTNTPTENFWKALLKTSSYYSFDLLYEFANAVQSDGNVNNAISQNMWRLGLLCDDDILNTTIKPDERLHRNRDLIVIIGQLSEESRKKISHALTRSGKENKTDLQYAYKNLQEYFKYGRKDTLRQLDYNTVQKLFAAPKDDTKKKRNPEGDGGSDANAATPLKAKEIERIIAEAIVTPTNEELENLQELLGELSKHFDTENGDNKDTFPSIGGIFENRQILMENHNTPFRKIVGMTCNSDAWGGVLETHETVLRDALSADFEGFEAFSPTEIKSKTSFDSSALFDFIRRFDEQFKLKKLDDVQCFTPILDTLVEARQELLEKIDLIMYFPILAFGVDEVLNTSLVSYVRAWSELLRIYCQNELAMHDISQKGTVFVARALLLLDVLYIHTPSEWKGMLLPMHPLYLWRYHEVFVTIQ